MQNSENNEDSGIDFYEAQGNVGDKYFLFTIQNGVHAGGGVSCYFWFESPTQLLQCVKNNADFWEWRDGIEIASENLKKIIEDYAYQDSLDGELLSKLNAYTSAHAGVNFWAWGTFENLCHGFDPFSIETRTEFREWIGDNDADEDGSDDGNAASTLGEPIHDFELERFTEYLAETAT